MLCCLLICQYAMLSVNLSVCYAVCQYTMLSVKMHCSWNLLVLSLLMYGSFDIILNVLSLQNEKSQQVVGCEAKSQRTGDNTWATSCSATLRCTDKHVDNKFFPLKEMKCNCLLKIYAIAVHRYHITSLLE